ncbi:ankyrin repeat domain protein [Nitzschia inconspicua]|uniref:Ankyrin repeat domain protein n=1 Tax=Nitzschia inconspicua TaxID=303405 RepID=A0A9K3KGX0_9STRA|nr:ankyrin repeat domain protein [Nitzschia inconspicua]
MTAPTTNNNNSNCFSSHSSCHHHMGVFDDYLKHCHEGCSRYCDWDRLLFACQQNKLDLVQHLITEGGVDPSYSNPMKQSALHIAARYGHIECLEYLLQNIPSDRLTDVVNSKNRLSGATPLHCCLQKALNEHGDDLLRSRLVACALRLVQVGADLTMVDAMGKTPLDYWKENFEPFSQNDQGSHIFLLGQELQSKVTV